ncbi:MAG: hypothetical protein ABI378_12840 [Chitinophagaceae bacterium]
MLLPNKSSKENPEEPPPVLKSWNQVYALIIAVLLAIIIFLYFFTRHFQ